MAKVTLELPKGILDFWSWYAQVHKKTTEQELINQTLSTTFSMMEQLQANEVADLCGLTKEYAEWKRDP